MSDTILPGPGPEQGHHRLHVQGQASPMSTPTRTEKWNRMWTLDNALSILKQTPAHFLHVPQTIYKVAMISKQGGQKANKWNCIMLVPSLAILLFKPVNGHFNGQWSSERALCKRHGAGQGIHSSTFFKKQVKHIIFLQNECLLITAGQWQETHGAINARF